MPFLKRFWWIILIVLLSLGAVGGAGYLGYQASQARKAAAVQAPPTVAVSRGEVKQSVTAPGTLVDAGAVTIEAQVNGRVDELAVKPGDAVSAGQVLVRLGERAHFEALVAVAQTQVMQAQKTVDELNDALSLAQAESDLSAAQTAYKTAQDHMNSRDLVRGDQPSIDAAKANLILRQHALDTARQNYDSVAHRPDDDYGKALALSALSAAQQSVDIAQINLTFLQTPPDAVTVADAQAQLDLAKAQLDAAQAKYTRLKAGHNPDRALAEAQLANARAALSEAQSNLASLDLSAPFAGIVTEVSASAGQSVAAGANLLTISNPQAVEVSATVVEEDLPLVRVGQKAELYFDALPDVTLAGAVTRIIPRRTSTATATYPIAIALDALNPQLAPGMTVDCSLVIAQVSNVLRLPRAVVRAHSDGTALVDVWANGQVEHRTIHVGLRGDSFVEVTQGLNEGDQVVAR
jgi:HlyD family secretion protein